MNTSYTISLIISLLLTLTGSGQTAQDYYKRGSEKYKISDYNGAIVDFSKAMEIDPKNARAYFGRGNSKYFLQDFTGAITDLTTGIEIEHDIPGTHYIRGMAKYGLKDYRGAIADFTVEIQIKPMADIYFYRGISEYILGQKDSGCLDLSKAGEMGNLKAYDAIKKYCQ